MPPSRLLEVYCATLLTTSSSQIERLTTIILPLVSALAFTSSSASEISVRQRQRVSVPEAHQAFAVDATSFYAIANRTIARYEEGTNNPLARRTAPAGSSVLHLNSGVVVDGRLYCANSNWPTMPREDSVETFDAKTLRHLESNSFSETAGPSTGLTAVADRGGSSLPFMAMPTFAIPSCCVMTANGTRRENGCFPKP